MLVEVGWGWLRWVAVGRCWLILAEVGWGWFRLVDVGWGWLMLVDVGVCRSIMTHLETQENYHESRNGIAIACRTELVAIFFKCLQLWWEKYDHQNNACHLWVIPETKQGVCCIIVFFFGQYCCVEAEPFCATTIHFHCWKVQIPNCGSIGITPLLTLVPPIFTYLMRRFSMFGADIHVLLSISTSAMVWAS